MLDLKKENTNNKNSSEIIEEENVAIHTMQEDLDSLSGIFPKNNQMNISKEEKGVSFKENKVETKSGQYFNPFLEKQAEQERSREAIFANKKTVSADDVLSRKRSQELRGSGDSSKKTIWIAVSLIVVGSFTLGGYYFWSNRQPAINTDIQKSIPQKSEETDYKEVISPEEKNNEEQIETEPKKKYSADMPNYLSIDTENPSYENFKEIITKAFLDIKNGEINKPIEFVITDSKNNQVSFPIFSAIAKLKLSEELLKNLSDEFSIFAYHDSGNPRLTLSIKVADQLKASSFMKNEESKLPEEVASLFLDNVSLSKEKVVFKEGNYKGISIRYFNLTSDQLSSVDYSFNGAYLIVGTSKNSMWAVLDKVLEKGE